MKRLLLILALVMLALSIPAAAQVTLTTTAPPYGYLLEPSAVRQPVFYPGGAGATTHLVNYSTTGGASLSCTSNCLPTVTWTMPAAGGSCSVSGSVGSYVVTSAVTAVITATSVDDPTKTVTQTAHVCDTTSTAFTDVEPSYQQAYGGQKKTLQSYVIGYVDQSGIWSITTQPGGGDGALTDTVNRDTLFSATVTGRYVLTYTSSHGPAGTAIVYVAPTLFSSLGYTVTPNKTVPTPCVVDPALTGTDYEVGSGQPFPNFLTVPTTTWTAGSIIRVQPGTYVNSMLIRSTGTPTQPLIICGIADSSGNLPVIDGNLAQENPASAGTFTDGEGGIKTTGTASGFGQGYGLGSVGPDYLTITGLEIKRFNVPYTFCPAGTSPPCTTPYSGLNPSGIWIATAQHLHVEGVDIEDTEQGMLQLSNTGGAGANNGRRFTAFTQVMGSHINNFSSPNSSGTHGLYIQGLYNLVEGNLFENPQYDISNPLAPTYEGGMFIKMRGGQAIVRYNTMRGITSGVGMQFDEMEDTVAFMDIASQLGQPGTASCGASTWCSITSNNITLAQLTMNMQALATDFYYGNVMSNEGGKVAQPYIQYGSYSSTQECANGAVYCTPGIDRSGKGYFWANTFDQAGWYLNQSTGGVMSTANYNTSGFMAVAQYVQPRTFLGDNVWWSDTSTCSGGPCFPWNWNVDAGAITTFQTNMAAAGALASSGTITGGSSAGWGGYSNTFTYPLFNPANAHVTGLSAPNFLTTASIPYNRTTFAPVVSSALINAGSQITVPEIAIMPVRFQPLNSGYMVARTDVASSTPTIGAVQTGSLPTFTAALSPSPSTLAIPSSAIGSQEFLFGTASFSDGTSSFIQYRSQPWNSSNNSSIDCFGDNNPACNVIANGTGNLTVNYAGLPLSVCFIVGSGGGCSTPTVAAPTFSPVAGTYTSTQSVTISTVTAGASVVYTADGSTPTVTATTCTITHGTLYSGPVSVATSQTLNAIGCKASSNASGVSSAAYVISPVFNIDNTMSVSTMQGILTTAGAVPNATVTFAAGSGGTYNLTGHLVFPCTMGTIYTGPINSAGTTTVNNKTVQQTAASPAVINYQVNMDAAFVVNGGSGAAPGDGCTIQYFSGTFQIFTGGIPNVSGASTSGVLIQNNTITGNTAAFSNPAGVAIFLDVPTSNSAVIHNWLSNCADLTDGCGAMSVAGTNNLIDSNWIDQAQEGIGSAGNPTDGMANVTISNNVFNQINRIAIEITTGNNPGVITGFTVTGNLYINPTTPSTGGGGCPACNTGWFSLATGNFGNPGSAGFTFHHDDNTAIANTAFTGGSNHMFYCEEQTSGSASTTLRDMCQGFWPPAPAVAVGNVTGALDLSGHIIEGPNITSFGAGMGCEYGGTFPGSCQFVGGGGTIPGPITANSVTTSATNVQHATTAPAISPASGSFSSPPSVTMSNTQPNVTIFYTTNGTNPTTASTIYTGAFTCSSLPCTVKSIAQWGTGATTAYSFPANYGWAPSSITSNTFTPTGSTVATPTFNPIAGPYSATQNVVIATVTGGATICYTTDGTTPTAVTAGTCSHGTTYSGPVAVATSLTIKAIGTLAAATNSAVGSAAYVITPPTANLKTQGIVNMRGGLVRH